MSPQNWDDLAECVRWAMRNTDVLVDTHWIGGDPGKAEPYGWASWSQRKGILALRNPDTPDQTVSIDAGVAFELPAKAAKRFELKSPWKDPSRPQAVHLERVNLTPLNWRRSTCWSSMRSRNSRESSITSLPRH